MKKEKICPYSKTHAKKGLKCKSNFWAYVLDDCIAAVENDYLIYENTD